MIPPLYLLSKSLRVRGMRVKKGIVFFLLFFGLQSQARISALFHPYDDTFQAIAAELLQARQSIDIAMYNMDIDPKNPVVAALASPEIQSRMQAGTLQVRLLLEGYGSEKKRAYFEGLGVDVRFVEGKTLHHKFAVIDIEGPSPRVISGSANWSLFSRDNYSENILFFDEEPEMAKSFYDQFEFLWKISTEFGKGGSKDLQGPKQAPDDPGVAVFFNSKNFKVDGGHLVDDTSAEGFTLTRELVGAIDAAQASIQVASTRIRLRPVYDALLRAAARGVKVQMVVNMDEYETPSRRDGKKVKSCTEEFDKFCSIGINYSSLLAQKERQGTPNLELRVKFYSLQLKDYLEKQMHSKYVLIDGKRLFTGSFNWSYSSEYLHIENLVAIDGAEYPEVIDSYERDFARLFGLGRDEYPKVLRFFEENFSKDQKVRCRFEPMSLSFGEIDGLINAEQGRSVKDLCEEAS
jgi:phosphatidylserine/phosphatidylglycerophosphate/cardiolipin synthase-like enzyme